MISKFFYYLFFTFFLFFLFFTIYGCYISINSFIIKFFCFFLILKPQSHLEADDVQYYDFLFFQGNMIIFRLWISSAARHLKGYPIKFRNRIEESISTWKYEIICRDEKLNVEHAGEFEKEKLKKYSNVISLGSRSINSPTT